MIQALHKNIACKSTNQFVIENTYTKCRINETSWILIIRVSVKTRTCCDINAKGKLVLNNSFDTSCLLITLRHFAIKSIKRNYKTIKNKPIDNVTVIYCYICYCHMFEFMVLNISKYIDKKKSHMIMRVNDSYRISF